MYCKGCNSLLNENDAICPKCGLDNNKILEETTEIYLTKISNPQEQKNKKNNTPLIITLIFIIAIIIIGLYVFKDCKNTEPNPTPTTSTTTSSQLNTFKFENLRVKYDKKKYTVNNNSIFLKENNNVNITFKNISIDEYTTISNSNELLDDKLGSVETKTYAGLNSYSHIFTVDGNFYLIDVNYSEATNESIQLELSRIIKSLYLK